MSILPGYDGPLEWNLRVSRRARYARLRILPFGGLEVVIPQRFPRHRVADLVAEHADWVRAQLAQQVRLRESIRLPEVLTLAFDGSATSLLYPGRPAPRQGDLFTADDAPYLRLDSSDLRGAITELRGFVRERARHLLPPLLQRVSEQTGLGYRKVTIRSQKTRWGSCSSRGHISLNDQLLFLPPQLVEYLAIHELCHTRHLDHSPAYWSLVESHCADYRRFEKALTAARHDVPDWFLLDLYARD